MVQYSVQHFSVSPPVHHASYEADSAAQDRVDARKEKQPVSYGYIRSFLPKLESNDYEQNPEEAHIEPQLPVSLAAFASFLEPHVAVVLGAPLMITRYLIHSLLV